MLGANEGEGDMAKKFTNIIYFHLVHGGNKFVIIVSPSLHGKLEISSCTQVIKHSVLNYD